MLKKTKRWYEEFKRRSALFMHKKVEVLLEINPSFVSIKVKDEGDGFDWRTLLNELPSKSLTMNGRGLILAKDLCFDRLEFSEKGNEVRCLIYVPFT